MTERLFLAVVGAAYLALAVWCSVRPGQTSRAVGYTLMDGSGQSEYFVVYGGLELGLGILFLLPLYNPDQTSFVLTACLIIHACLVLFRSISFFIFSGIGSTTYVLAVVEWGIFLSTLVLTWLKSR